jgi:Fanconi anemia group M protein
MYENKKTKAYYLIITKSYDDLKLESEIKGLTPNLLPGLVISLCQMGFVPLFVDDPEDSVKIISELCERFKDDPDRTRVINRSVNITTNNIITFPGVGNEKAERLITHFGSIRGVCNASIEELKQVYGVGNKLAKKIYNLSNGIVEDD